MAGVKGNRRTKVTQKLLKESLISLLQDNEIHKITVTDICKQADVNRGTFYAYYQDPYALLQSIEDELFDKIVEYLCMGVGIENKLQVMTKIFELAIENKELVKLLVFRQGDNRILNRILSIITNDDINEYQSNLMSLGETYTKYVTRFAVNGAVGVIQAWLENDLKEPPEEIAKIVTEITTVIFQCNTKGMK